MKRARVLSLVIIVFITVSACLSQTRKGDLQVGASISYGHAAYPYDHRFYSVSFSPSISYFFTNRFAAGLTTPFSFSKTEFAFLTIHSYTIGPTMRYYFPVMKRWAVFPQVDYAFGWQTVNEISYITGDSGTLTSSSYLLRLGFGSTCRISRTIALEGIMSLQAMGSGSGSFTRVISPSVNFALGLQVYLAKGIADTQESQ